MKKIKQELPEKCSDAINSSLSLIQELTRYVQELVQLVEDLVREQDTLKTKEACEACEKKFSSIIKLYKIHVSKSLLFKITRILFR